MDDVPVVPVKKTRAQKETTPAVTWNEVVDDYDAPLFNFDFKSHKTSGVSDAISENCTVLEAFSSLFTDEIQDHLVKLINEFAFLKNQINNPPKQYSIDSIQTTCFVFVECFDLYGVDLRSR